MTVNLEAPRTSEQICRWLIDKVAESLRIAASEIDPSDSFSIYGLDSMAAAELLGELEAWLGRELSDSLVSDHPTFEALARHLAKSAGAPVEEREEARRITSFTSLEVLRAEAVLDPQIEPASPFAPRPGGPEAVLLTGATGFIGAFLLRELLDQTRARVFCLVRAGDEAEGMARLRRALESRRAWSPGDEARVTAVPGDLSLRYLGLSRERFEALGEQVDALYHNGAKVSFAAPYHALKPANVLGTQEMLRLAVTGRVKPYHYVSSAFVFFTSGQSAGAAEWAVRENDLLEDGGDLALGYLQTKWVADKLVLIGRSRGIPVSIYRPTWVSAHTETGVFNPLDFASRLLRGCLQLGAAPEVPALINMAPVDYVARSLVHISLRPDSAGRIFHLANPSPARLGDLVAWLGDLGHRLRRLPYPSWRAELAAHPDNALAPFMPLLALEDLSGLPFLLRMPRFDCTNTLEALEGTAIRCPPLDADFVRATLQSYQRGGVLVG